MMRYSGAPASPQPTVKIPFNDLQRAANLEHSLLLEAADRVIQRGWFVLGPEVQAFEEEFAAYCGGGRICVSVANGSDALALALAALGVGPGDRVATCANAAMYATSAILSLGANPVFVDIDATHIMCPVRFAEAAASGKLKAVVITHLYGQLAAVEQLVEIADRTGVAVLEDCAQAHGAQRGGRKAGTFGDISTFSFYPTKNLGALGDGGAVLCKSAALADTVRALRQYGWAKKYSVEIAGGRNSRLDEMQAAFLRARLTSLDASNARRRQIAAAYVAGISHPLVNTPNTPDESCVAHLFVVQCGKRDALRAHLASAQIGTDIHYPIPDHRQRILAAQHANVVLTNTEHAAAEVLSLPCFPEMSDTEISYIINAINTWQA